MILRLRLHWSKHGRISLRPESGDFGGRSHLISLMPAWNGPRGPDESRQDGAIGSLKARSGGGEKRLPP